MPTDQFLSELQDAIAASDEASWIAGRTSLHGLSDEQLRRRLGAIPPPGEPTLQEREQAARARRAAALAAAAPSYPPDMDWRYNNGNWVTPVLDQGDCGSCVAFGTCSTIESQMRINKGFRVDAPLGQGAELSEAQLFFCNNRCCESGKSCSGWWVSSALAYVQQTGAVPDTDFPYKDSNQSCNLPSYWQSHITQLSGWTPIYDVNSMKTWLATKGPLITCFTVYEDFFSYKSGVYKHVSGGQVGGHCVICIGYDDQAQAWICKNSWGTGWGESGYFWIGYGQCGIDYEMWEVTAFAKTYFDWMGNTQIKTTTPSTPETSSAPALAMNNGTGVLYLVYRSSSDDSIWWSWYQGGFWRGNLKIQTTTPSTPKTSRSPTLVVDYGNYKVYLVYRSSSGDSIWWSWFDGVSWQGDVQIKTSSRTPKTSDAPAVAMYHNQLYLVYKASSDDTMWYAWFDGNSWQGDVQIKTSSTTPKTNTSPALCVYNDLLYLVYRSSSDSSMWYAWFDGSNWQGDVQIKTSSTTPKTSAHPAVVVNTGNNTLYLVYRSSSGDSIWWSWFDGSNWYGDTEIKVADYGTPLTSSAPALAINSNNTIYLVYRSSSDSSMWYAALPGYV